ncbi:hypothetical protein KIN20_013074 [Parelaphostrongylus tenuis]|uniref:Uncharacterized protein n=1 Tax=Parelaphostrongylus tenuis TaxID=148309 RepID=A0AAD5MBJ9_PARTN|nr:hypothetical protein KIN20_013074 [Parelaphostrongylus tenuis]
MQTITEVLEQQGHIADFPDAIISGILSQLMVHISYDPLECKTVTVNPPTDMAFPVPEMPAPNCIVFSNTVTALCIAKMNCQINTSMMIEAVPVKRMSITGSLTTTNIIIANWTKEMWQRVANRAVRMFAVGPFASHFLSAFATIS